VAPDGEVITRYDKLPPISGGSGGVDSGTGPSARPSEPGQKPGGSEMQPAAG